MARNIMSNSSVFVFFVLYVCSASAIEDYCSVNTFATNTSYMQFTKEPSVQEFAIVGQFKGLHCCAKGYRSIEWYKDGKLYPWPLPVSQFIIYPESANQTIYSQNVFVDDSGNYTCLLRNDTVVHSHTIHLKVFDKIPDDPQITYMSQDTVVPIGGSVRLFCEAFAGRVDLPDAYNEVVWRKPGHNYTANGEPHFRQEKTSREDGQTFGTYLIIKSAKKEDYGEYICEIIKPGNTIELSVRLLEKAERVYVNSNPVPIGQLMLWISVITFLVLTVLILNLQYGLPIRVVIKDSFGHMEENDGKMSDVLIIYASKDADLALGVLLPTLESRYNYKCASRELSSSIITWYADLVQPSEKCRRVIAVLSPAAVAENWNPAVLLQAIKQLQSLSPELIVVTLKQLPTSENEVKNSQGETFTSVARSIQALQWQKSKTDKFWLSLRLRLPPKRGTPSSLESRVELQGKNSSRLTSDCQESLDNLV